MRRALTMLGRALGLLMTASGGLFAQCAMCRTAAAAQAAQAGTLNTAILILLLPALALFSTVFLMAFRCPPASPSEEERDESQGR